MKNVLIINQSSELYGADKALLELIENYPEGFSPIIVLEHEGPLKEILLEMGFKVIKCPVIKLNRAAFSFKGIFLVGSHFIKGLYILRKETRNTHIDLVHSNAISVLVGAFYSFFFRKKHLWHVHEIVENPKFIANLYPKIVSFFSDKIVFNSKASFEQFLKIKPNVRNKSEVIYNGQSRLLPISSTTTIASIKTKLFKTDENAIVIGLIGRISRWKGQYLLLDAFSNLLKKHDAIHLVFVGSTPPDQDHFLHKLEDQIEALGIKGKVTIIDFQKEIWPIYDAITISVVPSIEPEPFGLVATEAMLSFKPVVAANHGGLSEIVIDDETGFLFEPRNQQDLENQLEKLIVNPAMVTKMGKKGNERVRSQFSTENYVSSIRNAYSEI